MLECSVGYLELRFEVHMTTYSRRQDAHRQYKFNHDGAAVEVASGKGHHGINGT